MIVICILIWLLCAIIEYGIIKAIDPDEVEGDEELIMWLCFLLWPLFLMIGIGYLIFHELSKLGEFVAGFINHMFKEDSE